METRTHKIKEMIQEQIADHELEIAKLKSALAALDETPNRLSLGLAKVLESRPGETTKKDVVLATLGNRWATINQIASETGLTRDQVRNVFHDNSVRHLLERDSVEGSSELRYHLKEANGKAPW